VGTITEALAANPETNLLDIETALRAAAGQTYGGTTAGFQIVLGMPAWHAALADAGLTVEQKWGGAGKAQVIRWPCSPAADFTRRSAVPFAR
jgi:hypothetical protein